MNQKSFYRIFLFVLGLAVLTVSVPAQKKDKIKRAGTPVLWERVNIKAQDTFYGPGGREGQPDTSRFSVIREDVGGHSKKYRVKDGSGNEWVAKIGDEAQSETASVRLLSALGYQTEVNYLLPKMTIDGKGTFSNVRLEARPDNIDRGKDWKWGSTPFEGTRQMKGLMLMMAFINNWDMKSANNVILHTGGRDLYAISDLGVSFGKTGSNGLPIIWRFGRSRNNPDDFANSRFVKDTKSGRVSVLFNGKNRSRMKSFTTADARWLSDLLNQLSDAQIRDAFRAANYSQRNINLLTQATKTRIRDLTRAAYDRRTS